MAKINDILEEIKKLTVVEVSDLVKLLEEEFGVSAAAPVAVAAAPVAGAPAAAGAAAGGAEEKATYNVVLKGAAAPVAVAAAPVAGGAAPAAAAGGAEEKSTYNVVLKGVADGGNKIKVIRAVKEAANLGLTEAKDMVENAPKTIKENVSPDEAKELAEKLKAEGAIVELA